MSVYAFIKLSKTLYIWMFNDFFVNITPALGIYPVLRRTLAYEKYPDSEPRSVVPFRICTHNIKHSIQPCGDHLNH